MRKTRWIGLFIALAAVSLVSPGLADKTTVDPNSQSSDVAASADDMADSALSQKITYDSGYKRLHAVVDDLSRISGMEIRAGHNSKDWRVRDIPVVVCVKDMPLGKLLRAIADTTHTWFASERIAGDTKKTYRIHRRHREEDAIDAFFKSKREAKLAQASWEWDALVAYGKSPDTGGMHPLATFGMVGAMHPISKLIAGLGPDAKDRLMNGETFRFSGTNPACKETIRTIYLHARSSRIMMMDGAEPEFNEQDAAAAMLSVKLVDTGDAGETRVRLSFGPIRSGDGNPSWLGLTSDSTVQLVDLGLPPYPDQVEPPPLKDDMHNPDLTLLSEDADWDRPPLNAKVTVERPKDLQYAVFADAIRAVAQASGCNIVVEDFVSHMPYGHQRATSAFGKGVRDSLREISENGYPIYYSWFFDEKQKLLVGWASERSANMWRSVHRNMLPESYLSDLKRKLDGSGVEFDDVIHLSSISHEPDFSSPFGMWIYLSRDLDVLGHARVSGDTAVLWRLYDSLKPEDKAMARSTNGLPLAKFDANWIADFFKTQRLADGPYSEDSNRTEAEQAIAEEERRLRECILSDPAIIASMVMRVDKSPARSDRTICFDTTRRNNNPALKLSEYTMVVTYRLNGEDHKMTVAGPDMATPIRSREREAQIIEAAGKGGRQR